jgi:copper chaperone
MTSFQVIDMTCGHCVKTITNAVHAVAPDSTVQCDVATKKVVVQGEHKAAVVESAIRDAGYTVQPVAS